MWTNVLVKEGAAACCPCPLCSFQGKAVPGAMLQDCLLLRRVLVAPACPELGRGFVSQPGRSPELFHAQSHARVCTAAQGLTWSLAGILKCCSCLVCKYLSANCTRRGGSAFPCSKARGSQHRWGPSSANAARLCWEGIAFPRGKGICAQKFGCWCGRCDGIWGNLGQKP